MEYYHTIQQLKGMTNPTTWNLKFVLLRSQTQNFISQVIYMILYGKGDPFLCQKISSFRDGRMSS